MLSLVQSREKKQPYGITAEDVSLRVGTKRIRNWGKRVYLEITYKPG